MNDILEQLLKLQEYDKKISRHEQEIEDIPARKADIREHVQVAEAALEKAEEELQSQNVKLKEIEVGAESNKDKIRKLQQQELEIKTNEEYKALQKEIFSLKQDVIRHEDEELQIMEEMENTREQVNKRKQEVAEQEEHIKEDIEMLDERLEEIQTDIEKIKAERDELLEEMDPKWLKKYQRVSKNRVGSAIVPVDGKT